MIPMPYQGVVMQNEQLQREIAALRRENARLRKDKQRLDWLQETVRGGTEILLHHRDPSSAKGIRAAIDAAIRQQKKEGKG